MKTYFSAKRFTALLLAFLLVFSLSGQAFATGFKDISSDYWAKDYISKLTELEFFDGYEDNTFRPGKEISYIETLVLLSRFYETDETISELLRADYAATVVSKIPSSLNWANEALCVCLASGIVSANELGRLSFTKPITKNDFSLLLVRALQLDGDIQANNSAVLPFADEASITGNFRGCVAILYNAKIVDGDDNNRFNPSQSVTRAVASAMLYRALNYAEAQNITFNIPGYSAPNATSGIITNVSGSTVRVRFIDGTIREFSIGSGKYYVNGTLSAPSDSHVGAYIDLILTDSGVHKAQVVSDADAKYVVGTVYSTSTTSGGTVNIIPEGAASSANVRYVLADKAYVAINGSASEITKFKKDQFIIAKIVNNKVTEAYGNTEALTVTGALVDLSYGSVVEMRVIDDYGYIWYFPLNISDLPAVYLGEYEISVDRLELNDEVTVTFTNGKTTKIQSDAAQGTLRGQITSIISNINGLYWEITDANGTLHKHLVADDAAAYKGKTSILLSSIKVGDQVSVSLFNSTITTVNLESTESVLQTGKISGTVLNVDNNKREIILLIKEKLFYINIPGSAPIYNAASGKALGISQVTPDSYIVAYGTYENSTTLNATLVVVESLA